MDERWLTEWARREAPKTCEDGWHISRPGNRKTCDCGDRRNPMYRTWWQRRKDKRARKRATR